jgi:hypothetical protein
LASVPFDHVDAAHGTVAFADATATRAIHPDRMHFVDVGHRAIAFGQIADETHRRHVTIHGIKAFKHNQLRSVGSGRRQKCVEMQRVVVTENLLLATRLVYALIIELRLSASDRIRQFGICRASVKIPVSLEM